VSTLTQPLRTEHAHLLGHVEHIRELAHEVGSLDAAARKARLAGVLGFLKETLVPHAEAEEAVLYPAVAGILGDPRATAPMIHDHKVIKEYAAALESVEPTDERRLAELLYGAYALILSHFRAEEELYVPLLEEHPEQAARVAAALEEHHSAHEH
jgi:hemerythrin superfamily protein